MSDLEDNGRQYKYYLLGDRVPVRVSFNEKGLKVGAETLDQDTGQFIIKNTLLSRIENSPEAEEINQEKFEQICGESVKKNGNKLSM